MKLFGNIAVWILLAVCMALSFLPIAAAEGKAAQNYEGYIWAIDAEARTGLPAQFRTARSPFRAAEKDSGQDAAYRPTRQGLDKLDISGSAQYSAEQFAALLQFLQKQAKGPVYIVDLRQETHFLLNNDALCWYGKRDWGNIGNTRETILSEESASLAGLKGKTIITAHINDDKLPTDAHNMLVTSASTEETMVRTAGAGYCRLMSTDHLWPSDDCIDAFLEFYKKLPANAWVHFHCRAGKGRTTLFMALYDMLRNPTVPLKDILYRQQMLGGIYLGEAKADAEAADSWQKPYHQDRAKKIEQFYQYVQQNHATGYELGWSAWLMTKHE